MDEMENISIPRQHSHHTTLQRNGVQPGVSMTSRQINGLAGSNPLPHQPDRTEFEPPPVSGIAPQQSTPAINHVRHNGTDVDYADEYTDERAREVITGRLIQGHIVDDDYPSPILSTMSGSIATLPGDALGSAHFEDRDAMMSSFMSNISADYPLGSTYNTANASDEEENFNLELEHTVTLVGNVKDKIVIIMDDMIDQCGSWIAAAETVVKKGGAQKVYCVATHGLFGDDSLESMENCQCIDFIVVTNSYPIAVERVRASKKLIILDISNLLAEAIKRNHYGESISQLYQHYQDWVAAELSYLWMLENAGTMTCWRRDIIDPDKSVPMYS